MIDWHEALGHSHPASILYLEQRGLISISGEKTLDDFNCRICKEAKSTVPHYQRETRSIPRPGEVVHVDLVGPFLPDMHRFTYLMVFVDEATRHKCIFGLRTKDEAYKQLQPYQEGMMLKGVNVEYIRGDGAGELGRSSKFRKELIALSLKWESSPPYTHQQQGLVERAIREIVEGGELSWPGPIWEMNFGYGHVGILQQNQTAYHTKLWGVTHPMREYTMGESPGIRLSENLVRLRTYT